MRKIVVAFLYLSISTYVLSSNTDEDMRTDSRNAEDLIEAMVHAYYPRKAIENKTEGSVKITGVKDSLGYLKLSVTESLSPECDELALSIIRSIHGSLSSFETETTLSIPFIMNDKFDKRPKTFDMPDKIAQFSPKYNHITEFLMHTLRYPPAAAEKGITGKVIVQFIIMDNGEIKYPRIVQSVHPSLDDEALKVIKMMPRWIPGKSNGKEVSTLYIQPFQFRLQQ